MKTVARRLEPEKLRARVVSAGENCTKPLSVRKPFGLCSADVVGPEGSSLKPEDLLADRFGDGDEVRVTLKREVCVDAAGAPALSGVSLSGRDLYEFPCFLLLRVCRRLVSGFGLFR